MDQRESTGKREHATKRLGIIAALFIVLGLLGVATLIISNFGVPPAVISVAMIVATAFIIRVIITGEWSETSWLGGALSAVIMLLGGRIRKA